MLRITQNRSASGAKKYYCEAYYKEGQSAQHNYYSDHDQGIGRWGGNAAATLGLTGDITKRDFAQLCDNINPLTGKTLTGRNDKDRTVGYDFTFNASKSVSLAYALGDESDKRTILNLFQQSVRETMADIETGMQARVRAKGKNENRLTGNIAYGEFTHFTTRPIDGVPDPHLHSHCFVFNATHDDREKKWKAGQFQQIKQDAPYYEAVFHSRLAHYLQQAGYKIERTKNGFEIAGIGKTIIGKYSRRTHEIEDYTREHNITDEKQKSAVGAKTREAKRQSLSAEQQEKSWLDRLTPDELAAIRNLKQHSFPLQNGQAAKEAINFSLHHHLERKSVVSDKEVLATAIKSSVGQATPEQVRQAFDRDATILAASEHLRTFITTKDALKEEKQLIRQCNEARNTFRPINEQYEPQNQMLNEQQRAAVRHALASTDGITIITGKAGTGKTTLMQEVKKGILASGKQIFSFAPSSEASRGVQRSEGFENADTVARLIVDTSRHADMKHQVIWIDEAGMLSNKDMNKVLAIAQAQSARVILSGDTRQHSSVERGDALRIIQQETGIKPITVSKVQRQKNAEYKEAVQWLSDGKTEKGFKQLDRMGAIHELTDGHERIQAIAADYRISAFGDEQHRMKNVLVIAPTHAEGDLVTRQIRHMLQTDGFIDRNEHEYRTLVNRQLTEAEKQRADSYRQGDMLAFHRNSKGIKAGSRVAFIEANEEGLLVEDKEHARFTVAFSEAKNFTAYEQKAILLAKGDKIRLTANGKGEDGKNLFNGSVFHVEGFNQDGSIHLSNGSTLPPEYGHFQHGYVSTSHAAQGKTADKVIISQSSATFRASSMEQFYVSVSRGKEAVSIYTDDKAHLQQAVSQSSQRTSATELMEKRQQQLQEVNRISLFRKWQEKAVETYDHFKSRNRNDGLSPTPRTEQEQAR
ncbi:MAG: relaxase domain-containing protein [Chitinophagaceae bacterium]|nr:relaxase domain-containing protein [Chitinophagaceae bacterium]